ncbi:MAG: glycosyltransferase [Bdellovibrionales bacterium]|nr:glycosyltransferase [Bdellovibrionales bacterium]
MRIIHWNILEYPSREANSVINMKTCESFADLGHEVTMLVPRSRERPRVSVAEIFSYYGVRPNFSIVQLPSPSFGGNACFYAFFGLISVLYIHWKRPRVVYSMFGPGSWLLGCTGRGSFFEAHGPPEANAVYYRKASAFFFSRWIRSPRALGIVTNCRSLADYLQRRFNYGTILPEHNAGDPPKAEATATPEHFALDTLHVGYIGQLCPGKGMEVIAAILESCPWAHFHVVGGSESEVMYWRNAKIAPNITFYGSIPFAATEQYRQACDVLLLPFQTTVGTYAGGEYSSHFMSPTKLFEYMRAGKAIISARSRSVEEVLRDGENALLCNGDAPEEWIRALQQLKDNPSLRAQLGAAAQGDLVQHHTWQQRARRILDFFDQHSKAD